MAQFAIRALCALMPCVTSSLAAAETVKIGFNAPLSGFAAADGNSALLGAELAVEEANAAGGIDGKQLELVVYDDQASPKEAVPIVGQEGYDSEKFIEIAGGAAEGIIIITTSLDRDSEATETQNFIEAFENKAGYETDVVAASAHTAVKVAIAAMQKAGSDDPQAIRDAIAELKLTSSTGEISFNELGEVRKDVQVQIVGDGAWQRHSINSDPVLLAPPGKTRPRAMLAHSRRPKLEGSSHEQDERLE